MKRFTIDEVYLCSVTVHERRFQFKDPKKPTIDELVRVLRGEYTSESISTKDHPSFTELREELGKKGYISIERNWWNGDRVLKPFRLNGYLFKQDEKFPSGGAMEGHMKFALKHTPARFK